MASPQGSLSITALQSPTPESTFLRNLAHIRQKTRLIASNVENGHLEKAGLVRTLIEPVKGWIGLGNRTDPDVLEYALLRFLGQTAAKNLFKREDIYLIKLVARHAGLVPLSKKSEKSHIELASLIHLISRHVVDQESISPECYLAYANRFYRNHKSQLYKYAPPFPIQSYQSSPNITSSSPKTSDQTLNSQTNALSATIKPLQAEANSSSIASNVPAVNQEPVKKGPKKIKADKAVKITASKQPESSPAATNFKIHLAALGALVSLSAFIGLSIYSYQTLFNEESTIPHDPTDSTNDIKANVINSQNGEHSTVVENVINASKEILQEALKNVSQETGNQSQESINSTVDLTSVPLVSQNMGPSEISPTGLPKHLPSPSPSIKSLAGIPTSWKLMAGLTASFGLFVLASLKWTKLRHANGSWINPFSMKDPELGKKLEDRRDSIENSYQKKLESANSSRSSSPNPENNNLNNISTSSSFPSSSPTDLNVNSQTKNSEHSQHDTDNKDKQKDPNHPPAETTKSKNVLDTLIEFHTNQDPTLLLPTSSNQIKTALPNSTSTLSVETKTPPQNITIEKSLSRSSSKQNLSLTTASEPSVTTSKENTTNLITNSQPSTTEDFEEQERLIREEEEQIAQEEKELERLENIKKLKEKDKSHNNNESEKSNSALQDLWGTVKHLKIATPSIPNISSTSLTTSSSHSQSLTLTSSSTLSVSNLNNMKEEENNNEHINSTPAKKPVQVIEDCEIPNHNRRDRYGDFQQKLKTEFELANTLKNVREANHSESWYKTASVQTESGKQTLKFTSKYKYKETVQIASMDGIRKENEDRYQANLLKVIVDKKTILIPLFGIYDGHGGDACSEYIKENLATYLTRNLPDALKSENQQMAIFDLLKIAFVDIGRSFWEADSKIKPKKQKEFEKALLKYETDIKDYDKAIKEFQISGKGKEPIKPEYPSKYRPGSTAIISLIIDGKLWVANVGDSGAILSLPSKENCVIALNEDAKPEKERFARDAEKRGATINIIEESFIDEEEKEQILKTHRVEKREDVHLAMTRAIGHSEIESGINPRSKIICYDLKEIPQNTLLILGSDGLWDVASREQIARASQNFNTNEDYKKLVAEKLNLKAYNNGSEDNITDIVVQLPEFLEYLKQKQLKA